MTFPSPVLRYRVRNGSAPSAAKEDIMMTDKNDQVMLSEEKAQWESPELRRLAASDAEGAGGAGTDNVVFS